MKYDYQEGVRAIPSTQPLKSPSPDRKNTNLMMATSIPSNIQLNRHLDVYLYNSYTPKNDKHQQKQWDREKQLTTSHLKDHKKQHSYHKDMQKQEQFNAKKQYTSKIQREKSSKLKQYSTQAKHSHSGQFQYVFQQGKKQKSQYRIQSQQRQNLSKTIKQKDQIICQLKKIINMMTQNGRHLKHSHSSKMQEDNEYLKHQVNVLTIQNQKLLGIVQKNKIKTQKMRDQKHESTQNSNTKRSSLNQKNMQRALQDHKRQIRQLQNYIKQKQQNHQNQIDQLIKSHKSLALQCKSYENQKQTYLKQNQKLLNLLKLKDKQKSNNYTLNHSQNHQQKQQKQKMFFSQKSKLSLTRIKQQHQQNIKHLKNSLYHQVQKVFESMTQTIADLNSKINELQDRICRFEQLQESVVLQDHIKKSQIYIQQAPSSQRYSLKKDSLSRILQQSRKSNQKLQIQLYQVKQQLQIYKQKQRQVKSVQQNPPTFGQARFWNEQEFVQLKNKIKFLQKELGSVIRQKQNKQKELIDLQMKIFKVQENHLASQKTNTTETHRKHQQQNRLLLQSREKNNSLKQQIQHYKERLSEIQSLFQSKQTQYSSLQESNSVKEQTLLNQINKFQRFIEQTETNYKKQNKIHEQQTSKLQSKIQQLNQQIENLSQQIKTLQLKYSQSSRLQNDGKSLINKKSQQISLKQLALTERQQKLNTVLHELQQAQSKCNFYEQSLNNVKKQNHILSQQKQRLESINQQFIKQIGKVQELIAKINDLQLLVKSLNKDKTQAQNINKLLHQDIQIKNKTIQSIIYKIGHNNEQNRTKTNQIIESIMLQIQEIQTINDELTQKNQTIQGSLQMSVSEKQTILKKNNQLTKQFFGLSQQKQILIQKIKYLEASMKIYQKQLTQRKEFCDQLISKHAIIQKQLSIQSRRRILQNQHKPKLSSTIKEKIRTIIANEQEHGSQLITYVSQLKTTSKQHRSAQEM